MLSDMIVLDIDSISICFIAFSDCLRREMAPWSISVHIIEPGHHKTNLFDGFNKRWKNLWEEQPEGVKKEFGPQYYVKVKRPSIKDVRQKSDFQTHLPWFRQ